MVKKLQALKAKKGFTLVELIVVIAIIGVLAAILVPTMMGMVTKSRVTSADQTAEALAKTITTWMSDLESNRGTIPSGKVAVKISGHANTDASGDNTWSGDVEAPGFRAASDTSGDDTTSTGKGGEKAIKKLSDTLANDYNFNSDITAIIWVQGRKVVGCAYCDTKVDAEKLANTFDITNFRKAGFDWGKTDGVFDGDDADLNGKIIGTNPKLLIDNAGDVTADKKDET